MDSQRATCDVADGVVVERFARSAAFNDRLQSVKAVVNKRETGSLEAVDTVEVAVAIVAILVVEELRPAAS